MDNTTVKRRGTCSNTESVGCTVTKPVCEWDTTAAVLKHGVTNNSIFKLCPWAWRLANGIMAVFFALAALVQLNDPDSLIWMLIYIIPCILCLSTVANASAQDHSLWKTIAVCDIAASGLGVCYLLNALTTLSQGAPVNPLKYEEGREMLGMMLVMFWLGFCRMLTVQSLKEVSRHLFIVAIAASTLPFVLSAYYFLTLDKASLPKHCKEIINGVNL